MNVSEATVGARAQIVWIVALVISTAVILHLERLDVGGPSTSSGAAVSQQADPAQAAKAAGLLADAQARLVENPNDADAAAAVLLALSVAVQTGAIDVDVSKARVDAVLARATKAGRDWQPILVWAAMAYPDPSVAD